MNECADIQAGLGAKQAQLPPNIASAVLELMDKATKVHKRLAEVAQDLGVIVYNPTLARLHVNAYLPFVASIDPLVLTFPAIQ